MKLLKGNSNQISEEGRKEEAVHTARSGCESHGCFILGPCTARAQSGGQSGHLRGEPRGSEGALGHRLGDVMSHSAGHRVSLNLSSCEMVLIKFIS